ncbi:MAG: hypothetical protein JW814_09300 [Candidatus Krumholzibacteriota bacterium]|nr:hypothetical protein [Candidatus Krumholzibacteriota bacterium]
MRVLARSSYIIMVRVTVMVLIIMLFGCGDDNSVNPSKKSDNQLVFTREDGSEVEFSIDAKTYVWCGPWESGAIPEPSLHVSFGSSPQTGGWMLKAVVADIETGDTLRFPNYFIWDEPDSVHIFLFDPPNELATDTEESAGFIVFHSLPCPDGTTVDFSIDAVMGSEYGDMPFVKVSGRFTAEVTGAISTVLQSIPGNRLSSPGDGCK